MASNTPNLNLYKKDPIVDGGDTFNITTMLNENWDKIDTEVGKKANSTDLTSLSSTVTQHLDESNPHAETLNRTVNVGTGQPFSSIQKAIDSVKKDLGGNTITISIANGTYAEKVSVKGFRNGTLNIVHASNSARVFAYSVVDCMCHVEISNGEIYGTNTTAKIGISRCTYVFLTNITMTASSTSIGVTVGGSMVTVAGCVIHNQLRAIDSQSNALVYSSENSGAGNTIALVAYAGGAIHKNGFQPTGTTNETAWAGGVIR